MITAYLLLGVTITFLLLYVLLHFTYQKYNPETSPELAVILVVLPVFLLLIYA